MAVYKLVKVDKELSAKETARLEEEERKSQEERRQRTVDTENMIKSLEDAGETVDSKHYKDYWSVRKQYKEYFGEDYSREVV